MIAISNLCLELPGFSLGPLTLEVASGSFFGLMGPTGSGKTLLLESLAGLVKPDKGTIFINKKDITYEPPEGRGMGLVYQDNALFPHMTVFENIIFGQRYHRIEKATGKRYAYELMEMLGILHLEHRKPETLSGGEKQRTAMARALACWPDIVLLDEPLSSLDPQFREGLRMSLKALHQKTGALFFMVTHDFVDALTLTDRAAVICNGRIGQIGRTRDIFHRPATAFIADFVGMKNIFPAKCNSRSCMFAGLNTPLHDHLHSGMKGYAALRPEDIQVVEKDEAMPEGWIRFKGTIETVSREGFTWLAIVKCNDTLFTARIEQRHLVNGFISENKTVSLSFDSRSVHCIAG